MNNSLLLAFVIAKVIAHPSSADVPDPYEVKKNFPTLTLLEAKELSP